MRSLLGNTDPGVVMSSMFTFEASFEPESEAEATVSKAVSPAPASGSMFLLELSAGESTVLADPG
ncbi:MAG: hypothetical protein AAFX94_21105, partial [Myxococcota bacterium]